MHICAACTSLSSTVLLARLAVTHTVGRLLLAVPQEQHMQVGRLHAPCASLRMYVTPNWMLPSIFHSLLKLPLGANGFMPPSNLTNC